MSATLAPAGPSVVAGLPTPAQLRAAYPVGPQRQAEIARHRRAIVDVLDGTDDRLLVVVGPCSVHDTSAGLHYARQLADVAAELGDDLLIVLRTYLEKPRTTVGWKGLLVDPYLDDTQDLCAGLRLGREFLCQAADLGLPLAYEFVEPMFAPYLADLVSWAAIGARTVASQPHRQLASALPMPVGMKNTTSGDVRAAAEAVHAAAVAHVYAGLTLDGHPAVLHSAGNRDCHVVLRGGPTPNYDAVSVASALAILWDAGLPARLMVDASHGNSGKDHRRQPLVVADLAAQLAAGERGLVGVMVESFLGEGRQEIDSTPLRYGVSVTDGCLGWTATRDALDTLAGAVRQRRRASAALPPSPVAGQPAGLAGRS